MGAGRRPNTDAALKLRRKAYRRGHSSEWLAAAALVLKGFRIVARRYRTTLVEAMEAIAYESERRIEGAADLWLSRQRDHAKISMRFDMVAVVPWRWPLHVENIFHGLN